MISISANLIWAPFENPLAIEGFPISGIHILQPNAVAGSPKFALPQAPVSTELPGSDSQWTPSFYRGFLQWWSERRQARPNDPTIESYIRIAFSNWELRILSRDQDSRLIASLGELQQGHQDIFLRTGLSQKFNQLNQFSAYCQGVDQHLSAIRRLQLLAGVFWGKGEINLKLTGFVQAEDNIDAETALLAAWVNLSAEETTTAAFNWSSNKPKFVSEFHHLYPSGFALHPPSARATFDYEPSHPDVTQALPPGMHLSIDVMDFYANGQLVPVMNVFRSAFGLKPEDPSPATIATDSPKLSGEVQTNDDSFKEVVVRKAKPKANASEPLSPAAKAVLDPDFLMSVRLEDEKLQSVIESIIGSRSPEPLSSPALTASLRTLLQAGNIPPEFALCVHVGPPEILLTISKDIQAIVDGASTVRILRAKNGSGKTHTLAVARILAQMRGLATAYAELTPDCRLHGTKRQVRSLISSLMRSLSMNGAPPGKGLRHLLETIRSQCPDPKPKEWLKPMQAVCEPLLDQPGGFEMVQVLAKFCAASADGDLGMIAAVQMWVRAEIATPAEAKSMLGLPSMVTDDDLMRHLKLVTLLTQIAGATGLLLSVDELAVLTRNTHGGAQKANQDVLLNILNASGGELPRLGFYFAASVDALDPTQRGLLTSKALESRLASGKVILDVPSLSPKQLLRLLQKVRNYRMPESMLPRLPDPALLTLLNRLLRPGWENGLQVRDTLKALSSLIESLEVNPSLTWENTLQASRHQAEQEDNQSSTGTKSQRLENLKL